VFSIHGAHERTVDWGCRIPDKGVGVVLLDVVRSVPAPDRLAAGVDLTDQVSTAVYDQQVPIRQELGVVGHGRLYGAPSVAFPVDLRHPAGRRRRALAPTTVPGGEQNVAIGKLAYVANHEDALTIHLAPEVVARTVLPYYLAGAIDLD